MLRRSTSVPWGTTPRCCRGATHTKCAARAERQRPMNRSRREYQDASTGWSTTSRNIRPSSCHWRGWRRSPVLALSFSSHINPSPTKRCSPSARRLRLEKAAQALLASAHTSVTRRSAVWLCMGPLCTCFQGALFDERQRVARRWLPHWRELRKNSKSASASKTGKAVRTESRHGAG